MKQSALHLLEVKRYRFPHPILHFGRMESLNVVNYKILIYYSSVGNKICDNVFTTTSLTKLYRTVLLKTASKTCDWRDV
jgi:hypothetical protein